MAVELREEARVAELKEVVGDQQGVRAERLRVLFAGRELRSSATLRVRAQTTVHSLLFLLHRLTVTLTWFKNLSGVLYAVSVVCHVSLYNYY